MPFDVEFLNKIRAYELQVYLDHFPAGARILEIGGGTGVQAKILTERGYDIISIDLANSTYSEDKVFDVLDYDGRTLPLEDNSVDIVFSSNVLEHIPHIEAFHSEMKRVLRPGGVGVHAMPTGVWTFWTIVTHYLTALQNVYARARQNRFEKARDEGAANKGAVEMETKRDLSPGLVLDTAKEGWRTFRHMRKYMPEQTFPNRHGEFGNVFTEIWTFSRWWWTRHLKTNGYRLKSAKPMRLFYTGYMFYGPNWSIKSRNFWSRILGSACIIYVVEPANKD